MQLFLSTFFGVGPNSLKDFFQLILSLVSRPTAQCPRERLYQVAIAGRVCLHSRPDLVRVAPDPWVGHPDDPATGLDR